MAFRNLSICLLLHPESGLIPTYDEFQLTFSRYGSRSVQLQSPILLVDSLNGSINTIAPSICVRCGEGKLYSDV